MQKERSYLADADTRREWIPTVEGGQAKSVILTSALALTPLLGWTIQRCEVQRILRELSQDGVLYLITQVTVGLIYDIYRIMSSLPAALLEWLLKLQLPEWVPGGLAFAPIIGLTAYRFLQRERIRRLARKMEFDVRLYSIGSIFLSQYSGYYQSATGNHSADANGKACILFFKLWRARQGQLTAKDKLAEYISLFDTVGHRGLIASAMLPISDYLEYAITELGCPASAMALRKMCLSSARSHVDDRNGGPRAGVFPDETIAHEVDKILTHFESAEEASGFAEEKYKYAVYRNWYNSLQYSLFFGFIALSVVVIFRETAHCSVEWSLWSFLKPIVLGN